jgi:DNA-binding NarL/FixJ family response regulator
MARPVHPCKRAGVIPSRCLIVDDNTSFREEMRALLVEQGLNVVGGAGSAADAHRQIAELRPDVALIDIDLGGESGLELARQLGNESRDAAEPRVILISTHDEAEYRDLIEASSAVGFLAKSDLSAASIRRLLAPIERGEGDES